MKQSLSTRIQARIDLARRWLESGIPSSVEDCPTSLNEWRVYHNPILGIFKIGSKSGYTTSNATLGTSIQLLSDLTTALNADRGLTPGGKSKANPERMKKRSYKPEKLRRLIAEKENERLEALLAKVTGQWHEARYDATAAQTELNSLKRINDEDRQTIASLKREIAELKRHLHASGVHLREV
ncbi:hypothetical protein ACC805_12240 [Rhizobium ruizarguesonis]